MHYLDLWKHKNQIHSVNNLKKLPGGESNIKKVGVLVVSLRGVNFRFWSRLGCCGKITNIFSPQGLA